MPLHANRDAWARAAQEERPPPATHAGFHCDADQCRRALAMLGWIVAVAGWLAF
eukprot:gene6708-3779_t